MVGDEPGFLFTRLMEAEESCGTKLKVTMLRMVVWQSPGGGSGRDWNAGPSLTGAQLIHRTFFLVFTY